MLQEGDAEQRARCGADHLDVQRFLIEGPRELQIQPVAQVDIFGQRIFPIRRRHEFVPLKETHAQYIHVFRRNGHVVASGGYRQGDHSGQQGQAQNDR